MFLRSPCKAKMKRTCQKSTCSVPDLLSHQSPTSRCHSRRKAIGGMVVYMVHLDVLDGLDHMAWKPIGLWAHFVAGSHTCQPSVVPAHTALSQLFNSVSCPVLMQSTLLHNQNVWASYCLLTLVHDV